MTHQAKEEYAIVLDFLPNGYASDKRPLHMKAPIAQAMGRDHFVLLELVPKKGIFLQPNEAVYMGEGKRDKIHHIVGKIDYEKLTETAKVNLEQQIRQTVSANQQRFIGFFNSAQPMNMRVHSLELLPGIGKKHMQQIVLARDERPFQDFNDVKVRIKLLPDPEACVIKRIVMEIKNEDKYRIFVGQ